MSFTVERGAEILAQTLEQAYGHEIPDSNAEGQKLVGYKAGLDLASQLRYAQILRDLNLRRTPARVGSGLCTNRRFFILFLCALHHLSGESPQSPS